MQWIKLTERMPNPDEHGRVLIYTEGYDFNGEQVFDVKAETLNECSYADPDDRSSMTVFRPEVDPSDQSPHPDHCHEIDHGTAEDRAVFDSPSLGS